MDGIEKDNAGTLRVLRLNIQSQTGQALAAQMRFAFTPTFILFDSKGAELWRAVGRIDPRQVQSSLGK